MEELIKYFESLEARISRLEQAQEATAEKLHANEAKLIAIGEHIVKMMAILKEVQNAPRTVVHQPAEEPKVVAEPKVVEEPKIVEPVKPAEPEKPVEQEQPIEPVKPAEQEKAVEPEKAIESVPEVASPNAALYGKAVDDIRQAISLGDRFLYQRELFNQQAELMQQTLTELNALNSFDEAMNYISRFNWDTESSTYQQFLITLHRRFG